ncbi:MAG TPA: hypothetical protein VNM67_15705 [Thermoanaerobaculia bacterium]|jgi:hypothetical protein|nr:hypothetical protein [Thermoanaerobaculia bacterium]
MAWEKKSSGGGGIAWLALLVSLAALFLSWKAYERSGGRLNEVLNTTVSVGEPEPADWREELDRARERLTKGDLEPDEVARMRESLSRSFRDASEGTRRGWRELDSDLERLQGQLREGSSRAKETLDSAVEKMKRVGD